MGLCRHFMRCHLSCTAFSLLGSTSILPKHRGRGCQEGAPCDHEDRTCSVWGPPPGQCPCMHSQACPFSPKYPQPRADAAPPRVGPGTYPELDPRAAPGGMYTEPCPAGATTRQPGFHHVLLTPSVYRNPWAPPTESDGQCQANRSSGKQGN